MRQNRARARFLCPLCPLRSLRPLNLLKNTIKQTIDEWFGFLKNIET